MNRPRLLWLLMTIPPLFSVGWQRAKFKLETVDNLTAGETIVAIPVRHVQRGASPLRVEAEAFSALEL